jgi:hypothetical protein
MQPIYQSQTGTGSTNPMILNWGETPNNLGIGVYVSGTVNYTVQYTYDDPSGTYPNALPATFTTPIYFNHATLNALAINADGTISTPVAAVRLTVNSGTGTAMMVVLQEGLR